MLKVVIFSLLFIALAYGDEEAKPAVDDKVTVEVVGEVPADCERKTKKFDQLSMHYTGTLTETGVKFDSR